MVGQSKNDTQDDKKDDTKDSVGDVTKDSGDSEKPEASDKKGNTKGSDKPTKKGLFGRKTKKKGSGDTKPVTVFSTDKKGSAHGATPFLRWSISLIISVIASLVVAIGSFAGVIAIEPETLTSPSEVFSWSLLSVAIPYFVSYLLTALLTLWIITQSTIRYAWWVFTQGLGDHIMGFFLALTTGMIIIGISFQTSLMGDSRGISAMKNATQMSFVAAAGFAVLATWAAYRVSWRVYRDVGARTMQQRYEDDVEKLEIKTSGKWWDRLFLRSMKWLTGSDGHKPGGFLLVVAITAPITVVVISLAEVIGNPLFVPLGMICIPVSAVTLVAAGAKYRDGRYSRKKLPVLSPVRGPDSVDSYNPESKGTRRLVLH